MHNTSISKLEKENYVGFDSDLEIALFEYGFAWQDLPDEDEVTFIYGVSVENDGSYSLFGRASFDKLTDITNEFSWANFDDVARYAGVIVEEWHDLNLEHKIEHLFRYYGWENVFGTCSLYFPISKN